MKSNNSLFFWISIVVAMGILIWLSSYLMRSGAIKPLEIPDTKGVLGQIENNLESFKDMASTTVKTPNGEVKVVIAQSDAEMEKGLGGVQSLPVGAGIEGMLFIFNKPDKYNFWMKDMNFPIDIVWIDANKKVVDIDENIATSTFPNTFVPDVDILYVLELNAGASKSLKITKNITLEF